MPLSSVEPTSATGYLAGVTLPDLVDTLIGDFLRACRGEGALPVTGAEGAQNVAWQLKIAEKARHV